MIDKLEEVARAICLAGEVPDDVRKDCEVLCSMCLDESRAAIKAMREPTSEMLLRHSENTDGLDPGTARKDWQSMIDEALGDSGL